LSSEDKEPIVPGEYWMSGKANIFDPFDPDQKNKILLNIVSWNSINLPSGESKMEPVVGMVKWPAQSGELIVGRDQMDLYFFLERHPKNQNNPYRNKRRKPLFFRIDEQKAIQNNLNMQALKFSAMTWANTAKVADLKAIAEKLPNMNPSMPPSQLAFMVRDLADKNPRLVILHANDQEAKKKVLITDAEKYNVLYFDQFAQLWKEVSTGETLCEVSAEDTPFDAIVNYYNSDAGKKNYVRLHKEMRELYEVVR
jgi:hypothetical protein